MITELITRRDRERAGELIRSRGLAFEEDIDNLLGFFDGGELAGTGARQGNILKMLALAPEHQGGPLLGELVTELARLGCREGYDSFFVFTRPENLSSFQALNFSPLIVRPPVCLLEYGAGLQRYLRAQAHLVRPGENGGIVMNCNPFTLGHRYLIEEAAGRVDTLYVFVVREDRSAFPFETRLKLVREGVRDLENVIVLDSSHYAVSAITFPSYFLKAGENVENLQMETDLELFGRHLAPYFGILRRFIGTEPYCRTTRAYGETMKRLLPGFGIKTVEIERRQVDGAAVSAYRVRDALRRDAFETVRRLVPGTTLAYLLSEESAEIRRKLKNSHRRH